ncbi:MAG: hypothetical protein M1549_04220 [Candidatus Dependentiae bacterium]|nr:hypothetical protein [Candidatus Dependentiae bacterium]
MAVKIEETDFSPLLGPKATCINPLFGMVLLTCGHQILLNLYQYGNPDHPLIKTIASLFHQNIADEQLQATASEANVAYGFEPYEMGWLLALIVSRPELFQNLTGYKPAGGKKIVLEQKLDAFFRALDATHKKRVARENPSRKSSDLRGTSLKKLVLFAHHAVQAMSDQSADTTYGPDLVPIIFSAFACAKSKDKNDLFDFVMRGFIGHMLENDKVKLADVYLTNYGKLALTKTKQKTEFLKTKTDNDALKKLILPHCGTIELDSTLPTSLLIPGIIYLAGLYPIPSRIDTLRIIAHNSCPDCTEAVILHLASAILFDHLHGKYRYSLLPSGIRGRSEILFTKKLLSAATPNDPKLRTAWFEFLAKRDNVTYKENSYGVRASIHNIFELIGQIFGIPKVLPDAWGMLGACLSTKNATISISAPPLQAQAPSGIIHLVKTYGDGSSYSTAVHIQHHSHAAILGSNFTQVANKNQHKHLLLLDQIAAIGLPAVVYASLQRLSDEEFAKRTLCAAKKAKPAEARKLHTILSRDLTKMSFVAITKLASRSNAVRKLLRLNTLLPEPNLELSPLAADWLLTTQAYKKNVFWCGVLNSAALFVRRALYNKNYDAIHFLLDTILDERRNNTQIDGTAENALLATWNELLNLMEGHTVTPPRYKRGGRTLPHASVTYRYDPEAIAPLFKKLVLKNSLVASKYTERRLIKNIVHYQKFIRQLIEYENGKLASGSQFTLWAPHTLYLLLQEAINGSDPQHRKICRQLLREDPSYLTKKIYHNQTPLTLTGETTGGTPVWKTEGGKKRMVQLHKTFIADYDYHKKRKEWALVPYIEKAKGPQNLEIIAN